MEKLRVGIIGLGARGGWLVRHLLCEMEQIVITAVCDVYEDRVKYAQEAVENKGFERPFGTTYYKEVLDKELGVMDATSAALCRDNNMPVLVFSLDDPDNIVKAIQGENIGTVVTG